MSWPTVRLGDLLRRSENWIELRPDETYREVTVRLWGKGVVERRQGLGSEIGATSRLSVRAGELILSRIDARNGAIGIVPPELDGAVVSSDFPCFSVFPDRLDVNFLGWLTKTRAFVEKCRAASEGTTNRVRLKEDRFQGIEVGLPALTEQRRIVARIKEFRAKIDEARGLSEAAAAHAEALCRSFLFSPESERWPLTSMRDVVALREPDTVVSPSEEYPFAGVFCFGRGIFKAGRKMGATFGYRVLTRLRCGNFVYPKLMAWEGALGMVPPECDGLFVSPEFPVFEVDARTVLPETLDVFFRTPSIWPRLAGVSTGTNVRRRRLHPRAFLAFEIPLPPMDVQIRLRATRFKLQEAAALRGSGGEALDALMPSILGKAFRGEL